MTLDLSNKHVRCCEKDQLMHFKIMLFSCQISGSVGFTYLSFCDKIGHDGGVAELSGQMNAAAAFAINQGRVCAVFHELHHHG